MSRRTIEQTAKASARTYIDEFPGEPADDRWATEAYQMDSAAQDWPDDTYGSVYWPAFEAAVNRSLAARSLGAAGGSRTQASRSAKAKSAAGRKAITARWARTKSAAARRKATAPARAARAKG